MYEIFALVGEVSEISLVRCAHSFDSDTTPTRVKIPYARAFHEVISMLGIGLAKKKKTLLTARNYLLHLDGPPVEESHSHEFLVVNPE